MNRTKLGQLFIIKLLLPKEVKDITYLENLTLSQLHLQISKFLCEDWKKIF